MKKAGKSFYEIENSINNMQFNISADKKQNIQDSHGSTFDKIYNVVKQIPKGRVATYGQVAELAGNKRWARVVGYALHVNPDPGNIPCYRVVTKDGNVSKAFAFGGCNRQTELLKADGIEFKDGHVVMEKYKWERNQQNM